MSCFSSVLQDLRAKLVKELPADPVDFLIKKLQFLQGKKKKVLPHHSNPNKVLVSLAIEGVLNTEVEKSRNRCLSIPPQFDLIMPRFSP